MIRIRNVVQQALSTGYLTIEAEELLRQMLAKKYDQEDLKAFMLLQEAAMTGQVKQQSRELLRSWGVTQVPYKPHLNVKYELRITNF